MLDVRCALQNGTPTAAAIGLSIFLTLVVVMVSAVCFLPLVNGADDEGMTTVTLTLTNSTGVSTILPDTPAIDRYVVEFSGGPVEIDPVETTSATPTVTLPANYTWTFTASAYDELGNLVLYGSAGTYVSTGGASLTVYLLPVDSGSGVAEVTVTWPEGVTIDDATVTLDGTTVEAATITTGTQSLEYQDVLDVGDYLLVVKLYNDDILQAVVAESVQIYGNLRSAGTVELTWEDFATDSSGGMTAVPGETGATLLWDAVTGARAYQVQVSATEGFSGELVVDRAVLESSMSVTGLTTGNTYWWRVRSGEGTGQVLEWSAWYDARSFTTAAVAAVTGLAPTGTTAEVSPELSWDGYSGASRYQVQVAETEAGLESAITTAVTGTSFVYPGMLEVDEEIWWRVRAVTATGGTTPWSDATHVSRGAISRDGLIGEYLFNGSGEDTSGSGNNAAVYGPSPTEDRFDVSGRAYLFSSKSDYIQLGSPVGSSTMTVSFWYTFNGTGGDWNTLLCRNGQTYHHLLVQNGTYEIGVYNGSFQSSGVALEPGTRYHIFLVREGDRSRIYLDGTLVQDITGIFDNASYPLQLIGNYGEHSQGSLGIFDDLRIYNRVITEEEGSLILHEPDSIGSVRDFAATPGDNTVTLSWVNPDHPDFSRTVVVRSTSAIPLNPSDGETVYTGSAAAFTDSGVSTGTEYFYSAFAVDTAGAYSSAVSLSVTPANSTVINFESGSLPSNVTMSSVGTYYSVPAVRNEGLNLSDYSFCFGLSTCGASCFDSYASSLTIDLGTSVYVDRIVFDYQEVFDNWGSHGSILLDGTAMSGVYFGALPSNSRVPDAGPQTMEVAVGREVETIQFHVRDITDESEIRIDDITVWY